MRTCVVGGGLAGAVLAWRLAGAARGAGDGTGGVVEVLLGAHGRADATAASGGAVRGYEPDPHQRALAVASLAELLASPTLRRWSGYRPAEFVYLPVPGDPPADQLAAQVAELEAALPGSASLVPAAALAARGWAGLPAEAVAVRERRAGYLVPGKLRDALLADCAAHRRVRLVPAPLAALTLRPDGGVRCRVAGGERDYDRVVVAAGAWTGRLLAAVGLPAGGYRTKSIQYAVYRAGGWRPPQFVDQLLGCYGRPAPDGGLLLGVPTDQWGADPDRPPVTPQVHQQAVARASARFPQLRVGPPTRTVGAVDCYTSRPTLSLTPVPGTGQRVFTFTGGAGGCVKTALAASRDATARLLEPAGRCALVSLGTREGQP